MAFCLIYNTHKLVLAPIRGKRRYSKAKSSEMRSLVQILKESPRIILNVFVVIMCIISISVTDYGPMALYCWTRCAENGIDAEFTNDGKCYMRLVTLYGWMILFGPGSMYLPQLGEMLELGLIHNQRDSCGSHTEKSKP